jgi:N-acetylmuramoyl-L-alanine amidase
MAGAACLAAACNGTARAAVDATTTRAKTHGTRKIAKIAALSPWEQAERGRDALEAMPEDDRTLADYTRAMDLYRAIYHANPADVHAPAAVNAVAELLAEQGRSLHDAKSSKAAVGQYEFLRTQYPASSLGAQALLAEGQIEEDELGDKAGLASLKQAPVVSSQLSEKTARRGAAGQPVTKPVDGGDSVMRRATSAEGPDSTHGSAVSGQRSAVSGSSSLPAMAQTSGKNAKSVAAAQPTLSTPPTSLAGIPVPTPPAKLAGTPVRDGAAKDGPPRLVASAVVNGEAHNGKKALVTGIRHWSTATYTRVAIDLGDGVT